MINVLLILLHLYFPSIEFESINISPDFLLILIIFNSFYLSDSKTIFLGFSVGLLKDFLIMSDYLGFLTLISISFSYLIVKVKIYKNKSLHYFLFFIFIYSYSSYFLKYSTSYSFYFKFAIIQSVVTFISFYFLRLFTERFSKIEKS